MHRGFLKQGRHLADGKNPKKYPPVDKPNRKRCRWLAVELAAVAKRCGQAGITVNKNAIPFDTNPPLKPSGIRIGTPAVTTRGMKEAEMKQIGSWIAEALEHRADDKALDRIRREVFDLAEQFPLYVERRARSGLAMAR